MTSFFGEAHEATPASSGVVYATFSHLETFLAAVEHETIWVDAISMLSLAQVLRRIHLGVHLTAMAPVSSGQRAIFSCTLMAAVYDQLTHTLLHPFVNTQASQDEAMALYQELRLAVVAHLKAVRTEGAVLVGASWLVPNPWAKVASGFTYRNGCWSAQQPTPDTGQDTSPHES